MKPLVFTCGDPAGIGPEIISAWFAANAEAAHEVAVIGPAGWLATLPEAALKIPVGLGEFSATAGRPEGEGALVAWAAMELAAAGCLTGEFSGVVTGPVSKAALANIGYSWPGQTEFFATRWNGEPVMAFCGGRLRVVLATWHVPWREVAHRLEAPLLRRTIAAADVLARAFPVPGEKPLPSGFSPRIGICGLNPHAGEQGLLGHEEKDFINPVLENLRSEYPGLSLCQPGDTLFARALKGEFDVVVALYHDQGLAPLKVIDFDEAVNVTLGLPFVRTSPDHGTAFGIAGQGKANPRSFSNAVGVAQRLINFRSGQ